MRFIEITSAQTGMVGYVNAEDITAVSAVSNPLAPDVRAEIIMKGNLTQCIGVQDTLEEIMAKINEVLNNE